MKSARIITHNGKAHFDEFLAISLILAVHDDTHFYIERREPAEDELNNPDIWVIDIGDRYEAELKNFDHHQDTEIPASFVIVAEHLGLTPYLEGRPWWPFKDQIDRNGGFRMAREMGVESLDALTSPLENFMFGLFAQSPLSVYQQMKMFGRELIDNGKRIMEQIEFWKNCQQLTIRNKKVIVGLTDETTGALAYFEMLDEPPHISITYDGRGEGWSISTIKDAPGINLNRLQGHELVKFTHKNGFIAKTWERIPLEQVCRLVELAIE